MPSADTFSIPPIRELLRWRLKDCSVIVDPFARNSRFGTLTNDLNPETEATHHLDALEFLSGLVAEGVQADAVLFDPPYSPRQISELYAQVGRRCSTNDTQNARLYRECRERLAGMLRPGGIAISCGWNSAGFGKKFEMEELMLVTHGGAHSDTIVTVERKVQANLF